MISVYDSAVQTQLCLIQNNNRKYYVKESESIVPILLFFTESVTACPLVPLLWSIASSYRTYANTNFMWGIKF